MAITTSPVTRNELKNHLKVPYDLTADDDLIDQLALAATEFAEDYQKRTYINRTRYLYLDAFENTIYIPYPPLSSVTSIKYLDTDGVEQTLSSSVYRVDTKSSPGRITLEYDQSWPDYRNVTNTITITYVAGYGAAATSVPDNVKAAIKLIVGHLYEHREAVSEISLHEVPMAAISLLNLDRMVLRCRSGS